MEASKGSLPAAMELQFQNPNYSVGKLPPADPAMFNGKPRAGNSREFPVSRETGGKFSGLGNSRVTGISRFPGNGNSRGTGNSRTTGIPEPREFPGKREFPVKNARAADRNVHSCQLRVILSCVAVVQWQLRAFETT